MSRLIPATAVTSANRFARATSWVSPPATAAGYLGPVSVCTATQTTRRLATAAGSAGAFSADLLLFGCSRLPLAVCPRGVLREQRSHPLVPGVLGRVLRVLEVGLAIVEPH